MKDVGDKIRRKHHLDTLGLEITKIRDNGEWFHLLRVTSTHSAAWLGSVLWPALVLMSVTVRGTGYEDWHKINIGRYIFIFCRLLSFDLIISSKKATTVLYNIKCRSISCDLHIFLFWSYSIGPAAEMQKQISATSGKTSDNEPRALARGRSFNIRRPTPVRPEMGAGHWISSLSLSAN